MVTAKGKLTTTDKEIKDEAVKHYEKVFKEREMVEELKDLKSAREKLCKERLSKAGKNKTDEWSVNDVTNVLKSLQTGKSKDHRLP